MVKGPNIQVFFALLRAGLWEQDVELQKYGDADYSQVLQLAEEQSVVGLVAAGSDHVIDLTIPKADKFQFIGQTLQLEQRNLAMNAFVAALIQRLRDAGIYTVLVKGQGVAQCYERPLWRACGDVDLFFDSEKYEKAKPFLSALASSVEEEEKRKKHMAMTIDSWVVELHGLMPTEISKRIDNGVALVQKDIFECGGVRVWQDNGVDVFLPNPDNDAIIIFTHYLQHFFCGGVGLRQISDWCRVLWTYRDSLDTDLLEHRLSEMGIEAEWKAFAAFAVNYLGMPAEAMPLYDAARKWSRKARRICRVVLYVGNFGHNKDNSYRTKYPLLVEKNITFFRRLGEYVRLCTIFPCDAPRFFVTYVCRRVKATI